MNGNNNSETACRGNITYTVILGLIFLTFGFLLRQTDDRNIDPQVESEKQKTVNKLFSEVNYFNISGTKLTEFSVPTYHNEKKHINSSTSESNSRLDYRGSYPLTRSPYMDRSNDRHFNASKVISYQSSRHTYLIRR